MILNALFIKGYVLVMLGFSAILLIYISPTLIGKSIESWRQWDEPIYKKLACVGFALLLGWMIVYGLSDIAYERHMYGVPLTFF